MTGSSLRRLTVATIFVLGIAIALIGTVSYSRLAQAAQPKQDTIHVVQPGDTLAGIALRYGVPMAELMRVNNIANSNFIYIGQRLIIPGPATPTPVPTDPPPTIPATALPATTVPPVSEPVTDTTPATDPNQTTIYIVQPGDTLAKIAKQFGVPMSALMSLNSIVDTNLIYSGQQLTIPAQVVATAVPTEPVTPTVTAPITATVATSATPVATLTAAATPTVTATSKATATAKATPTRTPTRKPGALENPWTAPAEAIEVFSPVTAASYHSPIEVHGYSQTFEGTINIRLSDATGRILGTRVATGGSAEGHDFFSTYLRFEVTEPTAAILEVFEVSAKDGTEINKVQIPIALRPGQRVVDLQRPAVGGTVCAPAEISGYSNTFEANVTIEISNRTGSVQLASGNTTGGNLGVFAEFSISLNPDINQAAPALIAAYETDAQDGDFVDYTRVPVSLYPAGSAACK